MRRNTRDERYAKGAVEAKLREGAEESENREEGNQAPLYYTIPYIHIYTGAARISLPTSRTQNALSSTLRVKRQ